MDEIKSLMSWDGTGKIYSEETVLALQAEIERLRKKVERARVLFGLERAARLAVEERLNALRSQYDIWRELNPDNDNDKEAEGN